MLHHLSKKLDETWEHGRSHWKLAINSNQLLFPKKKHKKKTGVQQSETVEKKIQESTPLQAADQPKKATSQCMGLSIIQFLSLSPEWEIGVVIFIPKNWKWWKSFMMMSKRRIQTQNSMWTLRISGSSLNVSQEKWAVIASAKNDVCLVQPSQNSVGITIQRSAKIKTRSYAIPMLFIFIFFILHDQGEFQDPKMGVLYGRPYFGGIHSPYMAFYLIGTSNLGFWNGHWYEIMWCCVESPRVFSPSPAPPSFQNPWKSQDWNDFLMFKAEESHRDFTPETGTKTSSINPSLILGNWCVLH